MPLGETLELYGRIENLFDARYTEVAGYGTGGRAAFVGARVKLCPLNAPRHLRERGDPSPAPAAGRTFEDGPPRSRG